MKKIFATFLFLVFAASITQAQTMRNTTTRPYKMVPYFMFTPYTGISFPIGGEDQNINSDRLSAFPNIGLDVSYHFIPNFAIYADVSHNFMSAKDNPEGILSDVSLLEAYAGPRVHFAPAYSRARPFVELGVGLYRYNAGTFTAANTDVRSEATSNHLGINAGVGVYVTLTQRLNFLARAKYHNVFKASDVEITNSNSSTTRVVTTEESEGGSYISVNVGLGLRL